MDDKSTNPKPYGIDFDALIERYMKEVKVPQSRKGAEIKPGVVPTGCLRMGTLEEGMPHVPVEVSNNPGATAGNMHAHDNDVVPGRKAISSRITHTEVSVKKFADKRTSDGTMPICTLEGAMSTSLLQREDENEAKTMSEVLLKANERVYPVSRRDVITKLKGMNKPRDAKLEEFGTDRERLMYMVTNYIQPYFEKRVVETVAFAKLIPGLRDLPLDDQTTLVGDSKFECASISGHYYDFARRIFYMDDGTPFCPTDIALVFGFQNVIVKRLELTLQIDSLNLTPSEESVIRALTIVEPVIYGSKLIEKEKVVQIYEQLERCLVYVISIYHDNPTFRLEQLRALLKRCHGATDLAKRLVPDYAEKEWPATFKGSVANEAFSFFSKQ